MQDYINKKKKEFNLIQRKKYLSEKYSNLIIINKFQLSATKIQRYLKKHFFHNCIYTDNSKGIYNYRCKFNDKNLINIPILENLTYEEILFISNIDIDIYESTYENNFFVSIDIENINIEEFKILHDNKTYYLSLKQKININKLKNKINNIIYQQNLAYQKSMAKDMKLVFI